MNDRDWARFASQTEAEHIKSGQTDYDTGTGFFLGDHNGTPKFSLGNSAANKVTWDGSTLTIVGTITATTGVIGGWTLGATYLEAGSGATLVRLDSGGVNPAISAGSATPGSAPFRVTQAGALTATSATITGAITATSGSFTGGVTVGTSGSFSSGQSAYDTGTGFWFEYNGGTPRLSLGTSGGNGLTWNGSGLAITGSVSLTNSAQTFTPTWTGFSSSPSGDLSYLDLGAVVVLWNEKGSAITGTSNATTKTISNLPAGIRPTVAVLVPTIAIDSGGAVCGQVSVLTDGNVGFSLNTVSGSFITSGTLSFTNSGNKGLPTGWLIVYPK